MVSITLYNFSKRENSLKVPSGGTTINALLKSATTLYNPSFELSTNPTGYTYLKYQNFYYYIDDIIFVRNNLWQINCNIDPLASIRNDILNTSAFVLYSSSDFDPYIRDERIGMTNKVVRETAQTTNLFTVYNNFTSGTYILSYVTNQPTIGASGVVWMDYNQASALAEKLTDTGFLGSIENQFTNGFQAIISLKYIPIPLLNMGTGVTSVEVVLGSYATGLYGAVPTLTTKISKTISITWPYSDFRAFNPFSKWYLYLPAYGYVEANPLNYTDINTIPIDVYIDGITGELTYILGGNSRFTTSVAVDVSIGTVTQGNVGSLATGIVASGAAMLFNPVLGGVAALTTLFGAGLNMAEQNMGNNGTLGGISSLLSHPPGGEAGEAVLYILSQESTVEPSQMVNVYGRPLKKVVALSSLSGYVQTVNASVNTDAPASIKARVNAYMDGGIYIE